MVIKLYVTLKHNAIIALRDWAETEHRNSKQQAAWIIEQELQRRGLLQIDAIEPSQTKSNDQQTQ